MPGPASAGARKPDRRGGQQRARPGRGQQRGGVAGLEPGDGHRPSPYGRERSWPGEPDQPGPVWCTRLRDQHGPGSFRHGSWSMFLLTLGGRAEVIDVIAGASL